MNIVVMKALKISNHYFLYSVVVTLCHRGRLKQLMQSSDFFASLLLLLLLLLSRFSRVRLCETP